MLNLIFSGGDAPRAGQKVNEWLSDEGEIYGQAYSSESLQWIEWLGLGVFAFSAGSNEVRVWPDPSTPQKAIVDTFSRTLEPIILQALGWQALHAGATVGPKGVLAFCGKKGSGKSTLAFAMHQAGWRQFADDALVLRFDQDCVTASPVPFTPRLRPASRAYFAHAHSAALSFSNRGNLPLAAVFLLQQKPELTKPHISLMPQARAFSEVLAHAHCFDVGDPTQTRRLVEDYIVLAARVPVFALEYHPDLQQLPHLTRAVVEATSGLDVDEAISSKAQLTVLYP